MSMKHTALGTPWPPAWRGAGRDLLPGCAAMVGSIDAVALLVIRALLGSFAMLALLTPGNAVGAGASYFCKDKVTGKTATSDHEFADCDGEQWMLLPNGRRVKIPSADEVAAREHCLGERATALDHNKAAEKYEKQLQAKYPKEAVHQRQRAREVEPIRVAIANVRLRLGELATERKHLSDDAEFYVGVGKPLPPELRRRFDQSDGSIAAENDILRNHEAELERTNGRFDEELVVLRRLWAGQHAQREPVPDCEFGQP